MVRVLAFGTFDLLHPGHVHYLAEAKKRGSELVVVIARDVSVQKIKGQTPVHSEQKRKKQVEELGIATRVVLGHDYFADKLQIVREIAPDIIVLGHDQQPATTAFEKELKRAGVQAKVVRVSAKNPEKFKSSKIRETLEL